MSGQVQRRERALAAFLVSLGIGAWLHWSITDPSFDQTEAQSEWGQVLALSALVLALAGGSAALGRALSGARSVRFLAIMLIAAGALAVRGARRLIALAPLASAIGVVTYLHTGGPILLCTWCAAAVYLLVSPQSAVGPSGQQA